MKNLRKSILGAGVLVLFLFVSVTLQASDKKSITLYEQSQISDSKLSPGGYKVEVVSNGETGELHFYKGKTVVAKAPFEAEKLDKKVDRSTLRYQIDPGNLRRIIEVRIAGEDRVFKIATRTNRRRSRRALQGVKPAPDYRTEGARNVLGSPTADSKVGGRKHFGRAPNFPGHFGRIKLEFRSCYSVVSGACAPAYAR